MAEVLSESGSGPNREVLDNYSIWAAIAADEAERELEERDIEELLGYEESGTNSPGTEVQLNHYDVAKRLMLASAFKKATQLMIDQAITLDKLQSELVRHKREAQNDIDQREKKLRLAESQVRLFRQEAERNAAAMELLRGDVASLRAQMEGWDVNDAGIIPFVEHQQIVHRLQEESKRAVDRIEAEKGHITFQLSRLRLDLAQMQNRAMTHDQRADFLDDLLERLKNALTEDEKQTRNSALEMQLSLECAERNVSALNVRLAEAKTSQAQAEDDAIRFKTLYDELDKTHNGLQERLKYLEIKETEAASSAAMVHALQGKIDDLNTDLSDSRNARDEAIVEKDRLQQLSDTLNSDLQDCREKLELVTTESEQLSKRLHETEQRRDSALDELRSTESARNDLEQKLKHAQAEIASVVKGRDVALLDAEQLKALLKESGKQIDDLKGEAQRSNEATKDAQTKYDEAMRRVQALQMNLDMLGSERQGLFSNINTITKTLVTVQEEHQNLSAEAQQLREALKISESQRLEASENLERSEKDLRETEDALKKMIKNLEDSRIELDEARKEISKGSEELGEAKMLLENLKVGHEKAKSDKLQLQEQIQDLRTTNAIVVSKLEQAQKESNDARKQLAETRKALESTRAGLELKRTAIKDLHASLLKHSEVLERIDREKTSMIDELNVVKSGLAEKTGALADTSESLRKLNLEYESQKSSWASSMEGLRASLQAELDNLRSELETTKNQQSDVMRENEKIRLTLADAVTSNVTTKQNLTKERDEAQRQLQAAQVQLVNVQERLTASEQQSERLLADLKNERAVAARNQGLIERLEAARQRMAAIYGLPTNSPLQSPDRTHPPLRLTSNTPSSSPPASILPPSSIAATDVPERPIKRSRLLRSTWPSIDITSSIPATGPNSPLPPAGTPSSSNNALGTQTTKAGTSAESAISIDEDDAKDVLIQNMLRRSDTVDSPVAMEQSGPALSATYSTTSEKKETDDNTPSTTGKRKRRKAAEGKAKLSQTSTPITTRRRAKGASEEKAKDARKGKAKDERELVVSRPEEKDEKPKVQEPNPKGTRKSKFEPSAWEVYCQFAKISCWRDPSSPGFHCGFCRLEDSLRETPKRTPLNFNPFLKPNEFWDHCRKEHKVALSLDADERVNNYSLLDLPQELRVAYVSLFTYLVSWKEGTASYRCGLCALMNSVQADCVPTFLDFDAETDPNHFFGHCRSHSSFWSPESRQSVHLVPDNLLS